MMEKKMTDTVLCSEKPVKVIDLVQRLIKRTQLNDVYITGIVTGIPHEDCPAAVIHDEAVGRLLATNPTRRADVMRRTGNAYFLIDYDGRPQYGEGASERILGGSGTVFHVDSEQFPEEIILEAGNRIGLEKWLPRG